MSDRMLQVNAKLQKLLAEIISQKIKDPFEFFITISNVECSRDLKFAKIFVEVLPFNKSEEALLFLQKNQNYMRNLLGKDLKMKFTPKLNFFIDDSDEKASKIYQALDEIKE